jgi:uncharacterized protein (TIGR04255 family)
MAGPDPVPAVYAHPPLVESWLGVDFAEPVELVSSDADALRAALGPEWLGTWQNFFDGPVPHGRQLTNVMGDRALRLTPRGFSFGWLGYGGERYPRYESVRDGFVAVLDAVRTLAGRGGRTPVPQRWSVRYVNRIPRGTVWSSPGDWTFFALWQPGPLQGLGIDPAGFQARWDLPLDAERGNLAIEFRHASAETTDETDNVWLTLTTSGPVDNAETGLFDGLDYGREVIIRSFNELVSAEAKTYWGVRPRGRDGTAK